jgi:hypothetical protein
MVTSTWEDRDLPVLSAIVELSETGDGGTILVDDLASATGLDEAVVQKALQALADEYPPFFDYTDGSSMEGREILAVGSPTGHARRTVGAWPTPESLADRLVAALAQAADKEPDAEKRGWLKNAALYLASAGRDIAVDVAGAALSRSAGLS